MKNIFDQNDVQTTTERIEKLTPESKGLWGKMTVGQMLAHCNVAYEMAYDDSLPKPGFFKKMMMNLFVKPMVVGEKPYKKNSQTAPQFLMKEDKDFTKEKSRLIEFINKTLELGSSHFEGKESVSFGALTTKEWNNLFYKHLDHHLQQFGV